MEMEPNVILITEAARQKGCTAQALRNAVKRGDLSAVKMGRFTMILRDNRYNNYQVKETGGRLHSRYLKKDDIEAPTSVT